MMMRSRRHQATFVEMRPLARQATFNETPFIMGLGRCGVVRRAQLDAPLGPLSSREAAPSARRRSRCASRRHDGQDVLVLASTARSRTARPAAT
jgi:hypothetical protein